MANNNIYVIGDTIIDVNTYGEPIGLSAETPTVCIRSERETTTWGGAAFVVRNLQALDQPVKFVSNAHVGLPPATKHRFWCNGYKLLQVNYVTPTQGKDQSEELINLVQPTKGDLVIFADYRHGLLGESAVRVLMAKCKSLGAIIFVDSQVSKKPSNHHWYTQADFMFVNEQEMQYVPDEFSGTAVVKRGANGASEFRNGAEIYVPGHLVNVVDTCGAGDAFLAAYVYQYLRSPSTALEFANRWAALKCTKTGMETPSLADV